MNDVIEQKIKEGKMRIARKLELHQCSTATTANAIVILEESIEDVLKAHTEQLKERVEGMKVDITPVKESMEAGMTLIEAEGVHIHATGYNNAANDVLAMLSEDK